MLKQNIDYKKLHVVKKSDVSAFAATHYHMSGRTVDREVDMEQVRSDYFMLLNQHFVNPAPVRVV